MNPVYRFFYRIYLKWYIPRKYPNGWIGRCAGWVDQNGNAVTADDAMVSATDFLITGLVYRKWYNPMRYIKGRQVKNQFIGTFTKKP